MHVLIRRNSKPIDVIICGKTQFGTPKTRDVGNSFDALVQNVGDGADLGVAGDIIYMGNWID